ncbi:MAG: glycosyltransferase [Sedimentisphaerales bacterium]
MTLKYYDQNSCFHMKICNIQTSRQGYSETFIREKIKRIPAEVTIVYGREGRPIFSDNGKPLLPIYAKIMSRLLAKVFSVPLERVYGIVWRSLPERFRDRALAAYLKKNKFDIVLVEYGMTGLAVMNACERANIPFVVHFHGYDAYSHKYLERYSDRYRLMFDKAAAIIAVSKDMVEQLVSLGATREKISYIPSGADPDMFADAAPGKSEPIIVSVGRFVDKKAHYLTLLAFKKVNERFPQAKLIFVGDGPFLGICKEIANAYGLNGSVTFLGSVSHEKVAEIMRMARAFVLHCITPDSGNSEGTPNVIMEASAVGLPVVSTKHAGIMDVVVHGETGFLVEERDVDAMAGYMAKLLENPKQAEKMGQAGRERIKQYFTIEISSEKVWQLIKKVVSRT